MSIPGDTHSGTQLAGYRLQELVGRGGMGVVYRAEDIALERPVALKLLAPELAEDPDFRERFLVESRLAASLDHPNVVPIYDAGEVEGRLYLAMRYVEGSDLKELLAREGPLEKARAVAISEQIAKALDAAHARGLVHRDVKPSNVLLDEQGHAYLADFGLTRRLSEQAPGFDSGLSLGTPAYVAPEQIEGREVDGRADQYSLGCLLYECLLGEPPYPRGSEAATLFAHLEEPPPAPSGLEQVLPKALAKDPAERYESCTAFLHDARKALGLDPRRVRWPVAMVGLGAALVGAALLAFFLTTGGGSPAPAQGGRLIRIDPSTNRATGATAVGDGPKAVAADGRRVWVASYTDGTLWRGDIGSGVMTKVPAFGRPYAVAIEDGTAYVAALGPGQFAANISTFDAVTGGRVGGLNRFACSLTSGPHGVWMAGCPDVQKLSSRASSQDPRIVATVTIPFRRPPTAANHRGALTAMAAGAGGIWVIGDPLDRRLWHIDPVHKRVAATIELGFPPGGLAVGGGSVWVTDELGDRVVRFDAGTGRSEGTIPVGRGARAVTFGAGSVWVADAIAHTLTRIDPETNHVEATIPLSASPEAVTFGGGSIWAVGNAR